MDKNKLIAILAYKLEGSGIEREGAIAEAKSFVGSLSDEDAAKLSAMSGNDAMMSKIAASLKKKAETAYTQATHAGDTPKSEASVTEASKREASKTDAPKARVADHVPAPAPVRETPVKESSPAPQQVARPAAPAQRESEVKEYAPAPQQRPASASRVRPVPQRAKISRPTPKTNADGEQQRHAQTPNERKTEKSEKKLIFRPDPNADYKKFYIILACTSPVWLFLIFAVATLFLVVIGAFAVAIVAIIAALVVAVAAGTTLSVVGIVYGITQLFKYAPIGLYEIGLGLKIGGYLMLGGIVAYNVAVRLLPFLIKKVLELFVFTAHKCVELYFYVKGACANL